MVDFPDTPNIALNKPEIGASRDTWGAKTNESMDNIDAVFSADGTGTSVGLNVGVGKTLNVGGTINLPAGAIPGTAIPDNSIAPAKVAMPATDLLVGRSTVGAGVGETVPCNAQGRSLLAAADPAALRTILVVPGTDTANTFTETQILRETDDTAAIGPHLVLDRVSLTPAASDALGRIAFAGKDTAAATLDYAALAALIIDPAPGTAPEGQEGVLAVETVIAGTLAKRFRFGHGLYAEGVTGGDKGDGTVNAKKFYRDGTELAFDPPEGSVVAVEFDMVPGSANTTDEIPADGSIPQSGEGQQFMTLSHTPKRNANKLRIDVVFQVSVDHDFRTCTVALFKDSTADALAAAGLYFDDNGKPGTIAFTHWIDGGVGSSAINFKVRAGIDDNSGPSTLKFNQFYGSRSASSITVTEFQGP